MKERYINKEVYNKKMKGDKKILLLFLYASIILCVSNITALDSLGNSKLDTSYSFCQICADASYINLSSIKTPSSNIILNIDYYIIIE